MSRAGTTLREGNIISSSLQPVGKPESVAALLARNAARFGAQPMYCIRRDGQFEPVTWQTFLGNVASLGRFLSGVGVGPTSRVAVLMPNCAEALVAEFATMCLGATYVPVFSGYPAQQTRDLIEHADPTVLILSGRRQLEKVTLPPTLRALVTVEPLPEGAAALAVPLHGTQAVVTTFADATDGGADPAAATSAFMRTAVQVDPGAPCLIMYTSGTSGRLKGVILTHDNILSQQRALAAIWAITPEDRFLSYLPWHHSFGGIFEKYTALYNGATLFVDDSLGKDFDLLLRNWMAVRPTVYFSAPRIHQQLAVHAQTHPETEAGIFHPALRFVFTAAAPLPANVSAYFAARQIPVVEGWGLTETSPCCTVTDLSEPRTVPGMVGYPIPGVRIKIANDGEILVQGPNVMLSYRNDPEATAAALPGDGWFHTGDLGELVGGGLRLIARKDRVFKLLNGEKVVPTAIENRLAGMNSFMRHVIVVGDGRNFLAALVFPDYFRIAEQFGDDRVTADRVVKDSFRETILQFNREHSVKYERLEAFAVIAKELSIEASELTPSLKVRVRDVLRNAEASLEAIYEPGVDCDCRFLRKVMRMTVDERRCVTGMDRTLDRCHECGSLLFEEEPIAEGGAVRGASS